MHSGQPEALAFSTGLKSGIYLGPGECQHRLIGGLAEITSEAIRAIRLGQEACLPYACHDCHESAGDISPRSVVVFSTIYDTRSEGTGKGNLRRTLESR